MTKKDTHGFLLAIETWPGDPPPSPKELGYMLLTLLQDHGYDVEVNVEGMGLIQCYEPNDEGEDDK